MAGLDPVVGHERGLVRPVVIVSAGPYNQTRSPLAAIVSLTKSPAKNPIHLRFSPAETGLESDSTALTDHARFVDRARLRGNSIGRLQPSAMARLNRHLTLVFGLQSEQFCRRPRGVASARFTLDSSPILG